MRDTQPLLRVLDHFTIEIVFCLERAIEEGAIGQDAAVYVACLLGRLHKRYGFRIRRGERSFFPSSRRRLHDARRAPIRIQQSQRPSLENYPRLK
jgi:hypothetical protein